MALVKFDAGFLILAALASSLCHASHSQEEAVPKIIHNWMRIAGNVVEFESEFTQAILGIFYRIQN